MTIGIIAAVVAVIAALASIALAGRAVHHARRATQLVQNATAGDQPTVAAPRASRADLVRWYQGMRRKGEPVRAAAALRIRENAVEPRTGSPSWTDSSGHIRDRSKVSVPPCPECGAPVEVQWIDVRTAGDQRADWLPGLTRCTANEDHDTRLLNVGTWAVEKP
jgi:hypothetical protein